MRMDIDGGSLLTLASDIATPLGGAWNSDGTIVVANNPGGPIFRISAEGGEAAPRHESCRRNGVIPSRSSFPMVGISSSS